MDQILSLCSGIGGLDIGFHRGMRSVGRVPRTIGMVERETFCTAVLANQMQKGNLDEAPIWLGDLGDLPTRCLPRVDWIIGGYPCQPFAHCGKRLGEKDPRHLWPTILELIGTVRPRGVFFENVAGHMSLGLDQVLQDLEGCGFSSAFGLFTAAEVGAPHRRERVFILGLADGDGDTRESGESRRASGKVRGESEGLRGRQGEGKARQEPWGCGEALADTDGRRLKSISSRHNGDGSDARRHDTDGCHSSMADTEDAERWIGNGEEKAGTRESQERGRRSSVRGSELADSHSPRLEGRRPQPERPHQWPARPGCPQRPHEPPRCVVSRLDRRTNGVPVELDRIDRLRALGNSVVPQCAEHAFKTLWRELQ